MTRTYETQDAAGTEHEMAVQAALTNPEAAQAVTLFNILKRAARTGFGVKHAFGQITSVAGYLSCVPEGGLHTHRSMIELQKSSGAEMLTMDDVIAYVPSASSGARRQECPVTVADMLDRQNLMADSLRSVIGRGLDNVLDLSVLGVSSYCVSMGGTEPEVSGFQWLGAVEDAETRAYLLCLIACSSETIDGLVADDLTAFDLMDGVLARHGAHILSDLEGRTVRVHDRVDTTIARRVRDLINPAPEMIEHLSAVLSGGAQLGLKNIFPEVRVAALDASTGNTRLLQDRLPACAEIVDLGCSLPEGLLSFSDGKGAGTLPSLLSVFFEFAEPATGELLGLHQIREGADYGVLVTTASGLYRCRLGLTARVVGWEGASPRLVFSRKGRRETAANAAIDQGLALSTVQQTITDMGAPRPFVRLTGRCDGGFRITLSRCSVEALGAAATQSGIEANLRRASLRYDRLRELGRIEPVDVVASPVLRSALPDARPGRGCNVA